MASDTEIGYMQKALALSGMSKPDGFNAYGLGIKRYGSGRSMPNIGPVGSEGRAGYAKRDRSIAAQKQALMERMQAGNSGSFASAAYLRGSNNA